MKKPTIIPPIRIYDKHETAFSGNGLRCLYPISAEAEIKENEAHSIRLEHPIDEFGAWRTLQLSNILYVPITEHGEMKYQPCRIYQIQKKRNAGNTTITVDARHCLYDLNYMLLRDVRPTNLNGQNAINHLFQNVYRPTANRQASDNFSFASDITAVSTAYYQNKTLTAALIGEDNSILNNWGGELYVDGFYFSVNGRKENAKDNAFTLSYNSNLLNITATYSTEKTYSAIVGQNSSTKAVKTANKAADEIELAYDKTLFANFSYNNKSAPNQFNTDFENYFDNAAKVSASYQVGIADLPHTKEYADFRNLENYEVGDTGTVYDEELDILTKQKIVSKKIDVLTQITKSITLGSTPDSITAVKKYRNTVSTVQTAEQKVQTITEEQINQLQTPKKTASGSLPLTFIAVTNAPCETWTLYGSVAGVDRNFTIIVNGQNASTVRLPKKLYDGEFIKRSEGGGSILHSIYDDSGEPLDEPTDTEITLDYLPLQKGANTVTVSAAVKPSKMEMIYK